MKDYISWCDLKKNFFLTSTILEIGPQIIFLYTFMYHRPLYVKYKTKQNKNPDKQAKPITQK